MAYEFKPTENHSLIRSRHTGEWVLQELNSVYGYYATIRSFGEHLGAAEVGEVARIAGVDAGNFARHVESVVRRGGRGMKPSLDFELRNGVTL